MFKLEFLYSVLHMLYNVVFLLFNVELLIYNVAERTAQYSDGKHQNRMAESAGSGERHL